MDKNTKQILVGIFLIFSIGGFFMFQNFSYLKNEVGQMMTSEPKEVILTEIAYIQELKGDVFGVDLNGIEKKLSSDEIIYVGDKITTSDDSEVTIVFEDNSVVRLSENSEFVLDFKDELKTEVSLHKGKAWTRVLKPLNSEEELQIKASGVSAAVRGTSVLVEYTDDNEVEFMVMDSFSNIVENEGVYLTNEGSEQKIRLKKEQKLVLNKESLKLRKKRVEVDIELADNFVRENTRKDLKHIKKLIDNSQNENLEQDFVEKLEGEFDETIPKGEEITSFYENFEILNKVKEKQRDGEIDNEKVFEYLVKDDIVTTLKENLEGKIRSGEGNAIIKNVVELEVVDDDSDSLSFNDTIVEKVKESVELPSEDMLGNPIESSEIIKQIDAKKDFKNTKKKNRNKKDNIIIEEEIQEKPENNNNAQDNQPSKKEKEETQEEANKQENTAEEINAEITPEEENIPVENENTPEIEEDTNNKPLPTNEPKVEAPQDIPEKQSPPVKENNTVVEKKPTIQEKAPEKIENITEETNEAKPKNPDAEITKKAQEAKKVLEENTKEVKAEKPAPEEDISTQNLEEVNNTGETENKKEEIELESVSTETISSMSDEEKLNTLFGIKTKEEIENEKTSESDFDNLTNEASENGELEETKPLDTTPEEVTPVEYNENDVKRVKNDTNTLADEYETKIKELQEELSSDEIISYEVWFDKQKEKNTRKYLDGYVKAYEYWAEEVNEVDYTDWEEQTPEEKFLRKLVDQREFFEPWYDDKKENDPGYKDVEISKMYETWKPLHRNELKFKEEYTKLDSKSKDRFDAYYERKELKATGTIPTKYEAYMSWKSEENSLLYSLDNEEKDKLFNWVYGKDNNGSDYRLKSFDEKYLIWISENKEKEFLESIDPNHKEDFLAWRDKKESEEELYKNKEIKSQYQDWLSINQKETEFEDKFSELDDRAKLRYEVWKESSMQNYEYEINYLNEWIDYEASVILSMGDAEKEKFFDWVYEKESDTSSSYREYSLQEKLDKWRYIKEENAVLGNLSASEKDAFYSWVDENTATGMISDDMTLADKYAIYSDYLQEENVLGDLSDSEREHYYSWVSDQVSIDSAFEMKSIEEKYRLYQSFYDSTHYDELNDYEKHRFDNWKNSYDTTHMSTTDQVEKWKTIEYEEKIEVDTLLNTSNQTSQYEEWKRQHLDTDKVQRKSPLARYNYWLETRTTAGLNNTPGTSNP